MRDDFDKPTKDKLALRVSYHCSNCQNPTSGPQKDPRKSISIGVAAHITAASPGGARYDPNMSSSERKSIENGIWLCQNCAKLIDNDPLRYPVSLVKNWKFQAEQRTLQKLEKTENDMLSNQLVIAYRFMPGIDLSSQVALYNIMYVNRVIGQKRQEIKPYLGNFIERQIINVGSLISLPGGGEMEWYNYESYEISVAFDLNDVAQSIRFEGFEQHRYKLDDYFEIFRRLGISVSTLPDIANNFQRVWENYHGYNLSLALNKLGGSVNIVHIYKITK